jgi:cell division protein FtsW (lipid II flippase)
MGYGFVFAIILGALSVMVAITKKSIYKREPNRANKLMYISSLVMVPVFVAIGYMVGNLVGGS